MTVINRRVPIIEDATTCIGKQVCKRSGKPFKSKNKYNTVKEIVKSPYTNNEAFIFVDDDSVVDVNMCNLK